jgi:two-component system CheB/CheR fusion protein
LTLLPKGPSTETSGAFLSQLAHELRNRLAPMRNAAYLLRRRIADDAQGQWALAVIDRQIDQLNDSIDALADFARIARGTLPLAEAAVDLVEVIDAAATGANETLAARRQTLERSGSDVTLPAHGDRDRLVRSLRAVIQAAAKLARPEARIRLIWEARGGQAAISIGAKGDDSPNPVAREPEATANASPPSGEATAQLTLAQEMFEVHGGSLSLAYPPHGDPQFVVVLPLHPAATSSAGRTAEP